MVWPRNLRIPSAKQAYTPCTAWYAVLISKHTAYSCVEVPKMLYCLQETVKVDGHSTAYERSFCILYFVKIQFTIQNRSYEYIV